jgi:hypothetical protein
VPAQGLEPVRGQGPALGWVRGQAPVRVLVLVLVLVPVLVRVLVPVPELELVLVPAQVQVQVRERALLQGLASRPGWAPELPDQARELPASRPVPVVGMPECLSQGLRAQLLRLRDQPLRRSSRERADQRPSADRRQPRPSSSLRCRPVPRSSGERSDCRTRPRT